MIIEDCVYPTETDAQGTNFWIEVLILKIFSIILMGKQMV